MNWLVAFDGKVYGSLSRYGGIEEVTIGELCDLLDNPHTKKVKPRKAFQTLPRTGEKVRTPVPVERSVIEYPRNCKVDAPIDLDLVIDSDGYVRWIDWKNNQVPNCVIGAVFHSLMRWRFRPAARDGRPVSVRHSMTIP